MSRRAKWQQTVKQLKTETYAIYLATKDPRVPWYVKALVLFVVAHTFSPIDLIPDFIPVLGYLDDLLITPLGILLALKLIPAGVMAECRLLAQARADQKQPARWWASALVILFWLMMIALLAVVVLPVIRTLWI